jgi:pyridoxamine 5'-phosphate oxidase
MNPNALDELLPEPLPPEPMGLFSEWLAEAVRLNLQPNPIAMVLATSDRAGRPSARVVLCKEVAPRDGYIVFYTNYQSHKGRELDENPRAAVVMHWDHLHRQVRIEGEVRRAPAAQSDAYFASRPWQSRIGAWASAQSQPVASRKGVLDAVARTAQRFGVPNPSGASSSTDVEIPRPPYWGGYRLWADAVELWAEGSSRVHDRARWSRTLIPRSADEFETAPWFATRLQP